MSDQGERRTTDITNALADLRVGVAQISTTQAIQSKTLDRLEERLNVAVLRDEFNAFRVSYEARHVEVLKLVGDLTTAHNQALGRNQTWRLMYSGALVVLAAIVGALAYNHL